MSFFLFIAVLIFGSASHALCAESQKLDRVRIGYSSISSSRIALWATNDMGFFKKNGLAAEVIVTPGVQGTQALIAGELQFYLGGVDSAALAAARGSDLVALATAEPIEYKLITQPNVKTVKDLRGKKIVVDRVGGTSYYISLQILEKVGLKTGDVELVQVGGGGNQRVAAFKSGLVSGVVTATDRFEQLKIPYYALADAMEMGIKVMGNSYLTTRSFRDQNKEVVLRTMQALVQGRRWVKDPKNRQEVLRIYNRYLPEHGSVVHGSFVPKKRGADSALSLYQYRRPAYFPVLLDGRQSNSAQLEAGGVRRQQLSQARRTGQLAQG